MHHGFAARNGFYAAMLAAGGFTGIKRVFERDYGGFLATFGEGHDPDPSQITAGLGQRWEVEHIVIKEHAVMGGIHAPLDALADIGERRRLKADEIAHIEVEVSPAVYHHGWWPPERPLTPIGAQMNIGYAISVAVLDGAAMVRQFSPARINSDDIWALLPRIEVRSIESFETGNARVAVRFCDGERIEVTRRAPRSVEDPQSLGAVAAKYRLLTRDLIDVERQAAIEQMVRDLERIDDMRALLASLAPPVRAPFE
jgi:aconitate decarboxylase